LSDTPPNPPTRKSLGLLIADVVGSTSLYERLGDAAARTMVQGCMALLEAEVTRHGGRTVKTMGDGMLCTFPSAGAAATAARAMLEATANQALALRVAAHCGEVLEENGDVFGDAVNTVARIGGLAAPGEVLVSRTLFEAVRDFGAWKARPLPPVPVKGKREPLELVAIVRRTSGPLLRSTVGSSASLDALAPAAPRRLALAFGSREVFVDAEHAIELGRDPANHIVIDSAHASRFHAKVAVEGELFVLQDRSSNGTWVVPDGQTPAHVLRRQTTLLGCGRIYLGADPRTVLTKPVLYKSAGDG
jgi:class 3 adenylate cyclase